MAESTMEAEENLNCTERGDADQEPLNGGDIKVVLPSNCNNHDHRSCSPTNAHAVLDCGDGPENGVTNISPEQSTSSHAQDEDISKQPDEVVDQMELGTLKKDDSGIELGRSPPGGSTSTDEADTMENDSGISKLDDSKTVADDDGAERPSGSNESGVIADFVDTEDSDPIGNFDLARTGLSDTSDSDKDSDSDDDDEEASQNATSRKRRRNRSHSNSSSTSSNSNMEMDESKSENSSDSEDEEPVKWPRDKFVPLFDMRKREIGLRNGMPSALLFRRRTAGSVSLARRLQMHDKLKYHEGCVNALHFNKSGTLLASGSDDLNIVLWKWTEGKPYLVYESGHRSNVFQSKFMPYTGDSHVVSCARDGQVRLAELSSTGVCKNTKKLAQHRGAAHKLALLQDSSHVFYSCGEDAVVYEIDLRKEKPNKICTTKENSRKLELYSIQANPFKSYEFCVGGRDHYLRVFDKRMIEETDDGAGGRPLKKFCPHHLVDSDTKANVTCAVYNYNGTEVLGTYNDEDIYLFDNTHSDGAEHIHQYQGHRNNATVKGVNFYGPKSEFVVSGSDCGNVFLWEKQSEKIVNYFHADQNGVINVLEPHPHAPILATSGLDHDVKIWMPTAKELSNLDGLKKTIKGNMKQRREDGVNEPDNIDGQMLWFLMQHLRRSARRRARTDGEEVSSSSSGGNSDMDSDGSPDEGNPMQCAPS